MRDQTLRIHQALVARSLEFIQRDLEGDLSLEGLAERAGVSPFHFHRLFSSIVGEPPATYVRRLRLERAARRLKHSRRAVTDIAFEAGYETHEAFSRAFKEKFGASPRRFRAERTSCGAEIELEAQIVRMPPRWMAFVRHVGPYDETGEAFTKVLEWAAPRGHFAHASLLGVYWDDQRITPPERTRCEVGLYVDDSATGDGEIGVRCLAGGDYAVIHHQGPSDERRRIYDVIYERWLGERGREPADAPPIEVYPIHRGRLEPFDLVTSVYVPLAPKRATQAARA